MIPLDPIGYAVNLSTGTVHTRYVGEHGGETQRTRTTRGVETLLGGKQPKACGICYPSPSYPKDAKPKTPQKRRSKPIPAATLEKLAAEVVDAPSLP